MINTAVSLASALAFGNIRSSRPSASAAATSWSL
jgi:hypothetical protein